MRIRIITVPGGQAPEEIRQGWVGAEIPVDETVEQPSVQQTGGIIKQGDRPVPKRVFTVFAIEAFNALRQHNEDAWDWWRRATPQLFQGNHHLLFDESACELID